MGIGLLFILIAFVLALFAGLNVPGHPRVSYGWLSLAFYFASLLIGGARLL